MGRSRLLLYASIFSSVVLLLMVVWLVWPRLTRAEERAWREQRRVSIAERQSQLERLTIPPNALVMLGDSLVERGAWSEWLGDPTVVNRGIGGDTAAGVLARVPQIAKAKPRAVVLLIGINDIELGVSREDFSRDIGAILRVLRETSPATKLFVTRLLPTRGPEARPGERVAAFDAVLEQQAKAASATWIDVRHALADASGALGAEHTMDGVHLTGSGYEAWANALRPALASAR